jgi:uncharacterized protein YifN (PemK superfamily)
MIIISQYCNGSVNNTVARQRPQHIPNTHQWTKCEAVFSIRSMRHLHGATTKELLREVFPVCSVPTYYKQNKLRI